MAKSNLTNVQKGLLFKKLAGSTYYDTGVEFGLHKVHPTRVAVQSVVRRTYKEVLSDPEKYGVSKEVAEMVQKNVWERYQNPTGKKIDVVGSGEIDLENLDDKQLVLRGKKIAWLLLNKKLNLAAKKKSELDKISAVSLAQIASTVFDKAQIVNGEATENIALRAKIDENITPEVALEEILKRRVT